MSLELIRLINNTTPGMTEHFLRKDYKSMYELWEGVISFIDRRDALEQCEFYERYEDMSQTGRLQLFIEPDGDICLTIIPDINSSPGIPQTVQFTTVGSGGGKSPNVRIALLELIRAIKKDNEENPISR